MMKVLTPKAGNMWSFPGHTAGKCQAPPGKPAGQHPGCGHVLHQTVAAAVDLRTLVLYLAAVSHSLNTDSLLVPMSHGQAEAGGPPPHTEGAVGAGHQSCQQYVRGRIFLTQKMHQ